MRLAACLLALLPSVCVSQELVLRKRIALKDEIRGAALAHDQRLFTWGATSLSVRRDGVGPAHVLARGVFGEGGCLVDIDGDGRDEFVGKEGVGLGPLTWRKPPLWKPVVVEAQTDTHDCLQAALFGRKRVLTIHRHMQVRFYEPPVESGVSWKVHEIYSIYTPSNQGGLALRDVDGDGRVDILCGNYWIQSPERFDLPWHIFAINTWFEARDSALHTHALVGDRVFAAQAHGVPARVAIFERPSDIRELWKELRVAGEFKRVHASANINGRIVFAEKNGAASRLFELRDGVAVQLASGFETLRLIAVNGGILSVGPREIALSDYRRK